ncbi:MAG TPA: hypothetical protein VJI52_04890 [Candidatus Nanoarchaeia archaeon]|nr:hypothetical protein [Candidatus Nanoarchaeia archaeon]
MAISLFKPILFKAKILELIPGLIHKDKIIEQEVLVELKSGEKRIFADENVLIKDDKIGKWIEISVYLVLGRVTKNNKKECAVGPAYLLKGKVTKLKAQGDETKKVLRGVLDCGAAKFTFSSEYDPELRVGDFIVYNSDIGYPAGIENVQSER